MVLGTLVPLAQDSNPASLLLFLVLMFVLFYFLLIRPQQKRQRAQRELLESLEIGDEVLTIGGMFGTITGFDEEGVTVEVAPDIEIRFVRSAIARKLSADEPVDEDLEGDVEDEEEEAGGSR